MARFANLMAQARQAAQTPTEKERIANFEKGLWDYMVQGREQYVAQAGKRAQAPPKVGIPAVAAAKGDLTKVDWPQAADLGKWGKLSGEATERKLEARIAHDGQWLYLQLTEGLDPTKLVPGGQVWDGDDFEAFFALKLKDTYRQICLGPTGKHVELAHGEKSDAWDSGVVVVSDTSANDRWTVRIALPLDKLLPGGLKPGATLYANFYRASPQASDLLAWTPTFANGFQDTSRLGEFTLR